MKKLIALLLAMLVLVAALVSCDSDESSNENDDSWKEKDYGEATVMGNWHKITIFIADSDAQLHSAPLQEKLTEWTGEKVNYMNSFAYPTNHDIIIGVIDDREISVKAHELLERMERESYFDARYLIYAEAGELAIAYDKNTVSNISVLEYAVKDLIDNYIEGKEYMAFAKGIVCSGTVDLIYEQELIDGAMLAEKWEALSKVADAEIVSALRQYYTLYTDSLIDWLANLYAPGKMDLKGGNWAGGFYGAPSGRDTQGFGPDITCTRQVLGLLESTGALDELPGGYGNHLPEKMKTDIVYMLKTLQDKDDGFFYHPQYDKETMLSLGDLQRRGRDLSAAITLFDNLGARPTYDTPTGMAGDGILPDEMLEGSLSALPDTLGGSTAMAVARVIYNGGSKTTLTASDPTDQMFASHAGFAAYLETVKINEESYVWGNQLNALASQIRTASSKLGKCTDTSSPWYGKTLVDMLIEFLNERIDPTTGMWEGVTTFRATNGFYKVISVYLGCKASFPMPQLAAEGLIAGLLGDQKSTGNICDVYNIWIGLSDIRSNVLLYSDLPADERAAVIEYIDSALERDGARAILNSYDKYLPYRYDDGSFSDNVGSAAANHNGLPVGLGLAEGDTNATSIAVGVVRNMYDAFDLADYKVPLYTESDWMRFIGIIMELDPVIKYSYLSDDVAQDFDSLDDGELESVDNITYSTGGVSKATIVTEGDNSYVKFNKFDINNSGRVAVYGGRSLSGANTVTLQFRMNVLDSNSGRISVNLGKYNQDGTVHTVYFSKSGDKVSYDSIAGWVSTDVPLGEWFTVKVVFFEGSDSTPLYLKTYINGKLMDIRLAVSKAMDATQIGGATLVPLYAWTGTLLYDDVLLTRTNETPTPDEEPLIKPIVIPEYDYATEDGAHTFDKLADGVIPSGCQEEEFSWSDGGVSEAQIVTDGTNKHFHYNKTATQQSGSANFKFATSSESANVLTVTAKMMVEESKGGRISFSLKNAGGDSIKTFYFDLSGNSVRFESVNGWIPTGVAKGGWLDIKFVYYEGEAADKVFIGTYVNDTLIDVCTVATKLIEVEKITTVGFTPLYAFLGKIRLDDITLTRSLETYDLNDLPTPTVPEAPSAPETPDTPETPETPDTPETPETPVEPEKTPFATTDGVHKFDVAEVGAVANGYSDSYFSFTDGGVSTAEIVSAGENKYYLFTKTEIDASGSSNFLFGSGAAGESYLSVSADLMIGSTSNNQRIGINLYAGSSKYLVRVFLRKDGSAIQIESNGWQTVEGVKADSWFTLRVDYFEGTGATDCTVKVYINGSLVAENLAVSNYYTAASINKVTLIPLNGWKGTVAIDNISLTHSNDAPEAPTPIVPHEHVYVEGKCECGAEDPDYVPEAPHEHVYVEGKCECGVVDPDYKPEPVDFETVEGKQTFDNAPEGAIATGYSNDYFKFTDGGVSTATVVKDGENKYLSFVKSATNASGTASFKFAKDSAASNVLTVSFKMKVVSANAQRISFSFTDSNSTSLQTVYFSVSGNNIRVIGNDGSWITTDKTVGEWIDVKFVYYEGDAIDNVYIGIYIGDTLVDVDRSANKFLASDNIVNVNLVPLYAWTGTIEIDDVSLVRTNETYDLEALPEVEPPHEHVYVEGKCECGAEDPAYAVDAE